jgi:hypothetical protein
MRACRSRSPLPARVIGRSRCPIAECLRQRRQRCSSDTTEARKRFLPRSRAASGVVEHRAAARQVAPRTSNGRSPVRLGRSPSSGSGTSVWPATTSSRRSSGGSDGVPPNAARTRRQRQTGSLGTLTRRARTHRTRAFCVPRHR